MERPIRKNRSIFALVTFVLILNLFLFRNFGLVSLWMILLSLWGLIVYLFNNFKKETKWVTISGSLVIASSMALYFFVDSLEKQVALVLLTLMTCVVSIYCYLKGRVVDGILEFGLSGVYVVKEYVRSAFAVLIEALSGNIAKLLKLENVNKNNSTWFKSIGVGLLVGLPIALWLISTLTNADPIFAMWVKEIVSAQLLEEFPYRIVFSIFIFMLLLPLLFFQWRGYKSPLGFLLKVKWGREMTVVLSMVVLILGTFLIVQWPYVFANVSKETDLSKFGVATYSEYVQRGFSDLVRVAAMVFAVSWVGFLLNKNQTGKEKKILLAMQGILGIEFVVFIISIFRRVFLYQSYHGLTLARLYGLTLLIAIVGMMATLAMRYLRSKMVWARVEIAWILLVIFGAILLRMEIIVISDPPTVNSRVDYVYLSRLSSDGKEGWKESYEWANKIVSENMEKEIIGKESRRDIYYASVIARTLIANYRSVDQRKNESLKGFEKFLSWNPNKRMVHSWMESVIGETNLLDLEKRCSLLQERISKQPSSEQGYDIDISMDSPFLR